MKTFTSAEFLIPRLAENPEKFEYLKSRQKGCEQISFT